MICSVVRRHCTSSRLLLISFVLCDVEVDLPPIVEKIERKTMTRHTAVYSNVACGVADRMHKFDVGG